MDLAFDNFQKQFVFAADLNKKDCDPIRYTCPYCRENLILVKSDKYSSYFKHRDGNNNKECNMYFKTLGINSNYYLQDSDNNRIAEFFFNQETENFKIGIFFHSEELEALCENNSHIIIQENSKEIINQSFDFISFLENSYKYFIIDSPFKNYKVKIDNNILNICHINNIKSFIFFKINSNNNHARYVFSGNLYTNTEYIVVSTVRKNLENFLFHVPEYKNNLIIESNKFKNIFYVKIQFKYSSPNLDKILNKNEYNLFKSEELNVIWPPVYEFNETFLTNSNNIFLESSFKLEENKSTNSSVEKVKNDSNIYKLKLNNILLVGKKNIDLKILKEDSKISLTKSEEIISKEARSCLIKDNSNKNNIEIDGHGNLVLKDFDYYLFSYNGCNKLNNGEKIILNKGMKIAAYEKRFKRIEIFPLSDKKISIEEKIIDALRYYPKVEIYESQEFKNLDLTESVKKYLELCEKCGLINSMAKKYIKEGI